jgi:hypothetical protein
MKGLGVNASIFFVEDGCARGVLFAGAIAMLGIWKDQAVATELMVFGQHGALPYQADAFVKEVGPGFVGSIVSGADGCTVLNPGFLVNDGIDDVSACTDDGIIHDDRSFHPGAGSNAYTGRQDAVHDISLKHATPAD